MIERQQSWMFRFVRRGRWGFLNFKDAINKVPVLILREEWGNYMQQCNASEYVVEAVLSQMRQDGRLESLHVGAGSSWVQSRDITHTIENSWWFVTEWWTGSTTCIGIELLQCIGTVPLWNTYWRNLHSQHDRWSNFQSYQIIYMTSGTSQAQWTRRLTHWQDI